MTFKVCKLHEPHHVKDTIKIGRSAKYGISFTKIFAKLLMYVILVPNQGNVCNVCNVCPRKVKKEHSYFSLFLSTCMLCHQHWKTPLVHASMPK